MKRLREFVEHIDIRELSQMLVNQKNYSPLREAVIHNHYRILDYLFDRTGSELVNCCTSHGDHNTLLHLAASNGYAECMRVLLCHGADIGVRDRYGRIPKQLIPKQLSSKGVLRLLQSEGKRALCDYQSCMYIQL